MLRSGPAGVGVAVGSGSGVAGGARVADTDVGTASCVGVRVGVVEGNTVAVGNGVAVAGTALVGITGAGAQAARTTSTISMVIVLVDIGHSYNIEYVFILYYRMYFYLCNFNIINIFYYERLRHNSRCNDSLYEDKGSSKTTTVP